MDSKPTTSSALMSIRPEFAERILNGEKQVEFRRRPIGDHVTQILIYATSPVRAVVGVAQIESRRCASPRALWAAFQNVGGIRRQDFLGYFAGVSEGYAYVLSGVRSCDPPLPLGVGGLPPRAPQAFQYVSHEAANTVRANLRDLHLDEETPQQMN